MKKIFKILVVLVVLAVITEVCYLVYNHFTKEIFIDNNFSINDNESKEDNLPLFTKNSLPRIDASLATQPLVSALVNNFVDEEVTDEDFKYSNTHPGYIKLIDGEKDLIVVTQPSEEELEYAKSKDVELEVIPVVNEGFVFYVNSENPVDSLTIKQIQDIYSGKTTNWKDVGGKDEEIKAFQRPVNSGSQTGMLALVMKDVELMKAPKENMIDTMESIINLVSDYDNGLNSIGYSYYYYATTMFDTIDETVKDKIKFIKVNGVEPNKETIKTHEYPFYTNYYIVIRKDESEDSQTRKLVEAMLSSRGQKVAEEVRLCWNPIILKKTKKKKAEKENLKY